MLGISRFALRDSVLLRTVPVLFSVLAKAVPTPPVPAVPVRFPRHPERHSTLELKNPPSMTVLMVAFGDATMISNV